ncbi:amidohydrolase family protein [Arcanobacterium haemolyticum]|nr:amidohydrolase family protein [Arcanobacterium haemolyticum]
MTHYIGEVLDGFGRHIGSGLVLDEAGTLVEILAPGTDTDAITTDVIRGTHIVPGLVDVHCHGGGGASFPDDLDEESIRAAIAAHRSAGTTALIASLVSLADPLPVIEALVPFCRSGELAGIHMEGPFVSPHKAGAQNPAAIRDANLEELESWLEAGDGWIRTMTIAPETANAKEAAQMLLRYGAKPSWGHTATDGATAADLLASTLEYAQSISFDGVPQMATHLFNAMPAINHREPGPIREFIQAARRGEVVVEMIGDGVHLKPILVEDVAEYIWSAGGDQSPETVTDCRVSPSLSVAFVTDAMSAAGMPEGEYELGSLAVEVKDGAARLAGKDTIAGGCTRLSDQLSMLASRGVLSLSDIVRAMVGAPAFAAGLTRADRPAAGLSIHFEPGSKPNFLVLDSDYSPLTVVREGAQL